MPPRPENLSKVIDTPATIMSGEKTCQELYGPYPRAIPVPFLSKDEDVPAASVIDNAKTIYDVKECDYRDQGTPDSWLPRDGRLVRLTGRHPFNVEPPMAIHNKYRFITPSSLHYVRNHGACPKLKWEDHTVIFGGPCATNPFEISMDELAAMEFLYDKLKTTKTNKEFFDSMKR